MFTLKALKQRLWKRWVSPALANPPRPTARPRLEVLEDRTLLSVWVPTPQAVVYEASPPAALSVQEANSMATATIDRLSHLVTTLQQDAIGAYQLLNREIAQVVAFLEQRLDPFFGINPNAQNQSPTTSASQSGSDWGSGSGSGSSSTASEGSQAPVNGVMKAQPMDSNGQPGDRYEWDPGVGYNVVYGSGGGGGGGSATHIVTPNDGLASNPGNWLKNEQIQTIHVWLGETTTIPGNEAGDTVILGSSYAGLAGLQPIEWNQNFTFSTLSVTGSYSAQQTFDSGVTLELTGLASGFSTSMSTDAGTEVDDEFEGNNNLQFDSGAGFDGTVYVAFLAPGSVVTINGSVATYNNSVTFEDTGKVNVINGGTLNLANGLGVTQSSGSPINVTNGTLNIASDPDGKGTSTL